MHIDSIKNGIVLDHIKAGKAMELYRVLALNKLECSVAVLMNVPSQKMGRKDMIKITEDYEVDLGILGYIDPGITVNIIRDGELVEKKHLALPERLVNVTHCKNPRCITVAEPQLDAIFLLNDREKRTYRCAYCDTEKQRKI